MTEDRDKRAYDERKADALETFEKFAGFLEEAAKKMREEVEEGHEMCCAKDLVVTMEAAQFTHDQIDHYIGLEVQEAFRTHNDETAGVIVQLLRNLITEGREDEPSQN